ncbi:MAG: SAM-dependent chlorinase/fluorinase [Candidatus Omnitrophota bacterium]|nr:SAM-dependent chlorinase/fluorinase [Candidatus Omnitrophota bacterium]
MICAPIVLMTDFGLRDHYVGSMKGAILSEAPRATIVDLTHQIAPQDVQGAARALKVSFEYFPSGTVFVCVIDPGVGSRRRIICVKARGQFFLAPDNGLLTPILLKPKGIKIRSVENPDYLIKGRVSKTFHGRDIFAPVAAALLKSGGVWGRLGPLVSSAKMISLPVVRKMVGGIRGKIIAFDSFGNAVSNISEADVGQSRWKRAVVYCNGKRVGQLQMNYEVGRGPLVALLNSSWELEIAKPGGSARKAAGIRLGAAVTVRYEKA